MTSISLFLTMAALMMAMANKKKKTKHPLIPCLISLKENGLITK